MRFHLYRLAVLGLWLATMSWLVIYKILPPLLLGQPPIYASAAVDRNRPPTGWYLNLNNSRLGWALSETIRQPTDVTVIHSLVHFDGLPLDRLMPSYLWQFAPKSSLIAKGLETDVESKMLINPLDQLQSFDATVKFRPKSGQSLVHIEGNVDGDTLKLSFRAGDMPQQTWPLAMPENKIRDSFSPETELRGLHLGQTWTIVTYNPLDLPTNPMDLLSHRAATKVLLARVEEKTSMLWNGKTEPVWLVVYRTETSQTPDDDRNVRNRIWVRMDGTVIRQEVRVGGISLVFSRMADKAAAEIRAARTEFVNQQP